MGEAKREEATGAAGGMVVIHVKRSEEHQFLYETTVEAEVSACVKDLCEIQNTRLRIQRLKLEGEELAKHGVSKHPEKQSLDEFQAKPHELRAKPGEPANLAGMGASASVRQKPEGWPSERCSL